MTNAEQYFFELMKDEEFKKHFFQEKLRLDIEYQLDDLKEKILSGKPTSTLIRRVNKIKKSITMN